MSFISQQIVYPLKDIVEKKGRTGRLFITKSDAKYWNQYKALTATGWGTQIMIGTDVTEEDRITYEGTNYAVENILIKRGYNGDKHHKKLLLVKEKRNG